MFIRFKYHLLIVLSLLIILPVLAQDLYVDTKDWGFEIDVPPAMKQRMVDQNLKKARACATEAITNKDKAEAIDKGPCICGAVSHIKCKTPAICEPQEKKTMDLLRDQASKAIQRGKKIISTISHLKKEEKTAKALTKSRELDKEINDLETLRDKFQTELNKDHLKDDGALRFQLSGLEILSIYKQFSDELLEAMENGDDKNMAKAVNAATTTAIEALMTGDPAKIKIAMAHASKLAIELVVQVKKMPKDKSDIIKKANTAYGLIIAMGETYEEWDREHDKRKLARRSLNISEDLVSLIPGKQVGMGLSVFKLTENATSAALLAWSIKDAIQAIQLNSELSRDAKVLLLKKVNRLNSKINFKKRQRKAYE